MFTINPAHLAFSVAITCVLTQPTLAAQAEQKNDACYTQLVKLLNKEIGCLQTVKDQTSAEVAIAALQVIYQEQANLHKIQPDEQSFSLYVLRTDKRKAEINFLLMSIARERQLIERANGYGCDALLQLINAQ